MAKRIFINYRRDDEPGYTQALRQQLEKVFQGNVFMDVRDIELGQDFVEEVIFRVNGCDVLLVVIGPEWERLLARHAGNRLTRAVDMLGDVMGLPPRTSRPFPDIVVTEIEAAIDQSKRVIPVLVRRTVMPSRAVLPRSIRALANLNAAYLRHERFEDDCLALTAFIEKKLAEAEEERTRTELPKIKATRAALTRPFNWRHRLLIFERLVLTVALGGWLIYWMQIRVPTARLSAGPPLKTTLLTPADERALNATDRFRECDVCPEMVVVPAGSFIMGSAASEKGRSLNEGPPRQVAIARFAVSRFEVTFAEWDACVDAGGCTYRSDAGWGRGDRPVINVSWNEITREYLPWLSLKTGQTYRLLTEAEWEYAARAGSTTRYAVGDTITAGDAWYSYSIWGSARGTVEVGSFPANGFGLHDMHGNVWEWVQDCYKDSYVGAPVDGSAMLSGDCAYRVFRGGSWFVFPEFLRSAARLGDAPDHRLRSLGFRVARKLAPPEL